MTEAHTGASDAVEPPPSLEGDALLEDWRTRTRWVPQGYGAIEAPRKDFCAWLQEVLGEKAHRR